MGGTEEAEGAVQARFHLREGKEEERGEAGSRREGKERERGHSQSVI